jgi:hypothetical protein
MNQEILNDLRLKAYRTIYILNAIERGDRSSTMIAKKASRVLLDCTKQLADHYLIATDAKNDQEESV